MLSSFLEDLSSALSTLDNWKDRPSLRPRLTWVLMANGEAEPDDNIILFGFEGDSPKPIMVAKIPRLPKNEWMLQIEYDHLMEAWHRLGAQAVFRLPEPLALLRLRGQPALVLTYLDGESLLRASKKRFWEYSTQVRDFFVDSAQSLREMNDLTSVPLRTDLNLVASYIQKIEKFKELNNLSEHELNALGELVVCLNTQTLAATHMVLLQGDFWHGNIIRGSEHGKLMFLDWQYSHWSSDISLDVYMFLLAAALAAVPRRSDEERAKDAIRVLMNWRSGTIPAYLSAYGKPDRYSLLPARYGMLLCCIEKNVRSVIDFGHNQQGDSVWRALFSELVNLSEESDFCDGI